MSTLKPEVRFRSSAVLRKVKKKYCSIVIAGGGTAGPCSRAKHLPANSIEFVANFKRLSYIVIHIGKVLIMVAIQLLTVRISTSL